MSFDRARAEAVFDAFLAPYDPHDPKIALKAAHTRQVAATAGRIARDLGFPEGDQDLAWLLGLLHDLGRFEQVRRFGTFNDAVSASHARLSVELLRADGKALLRRWGLPETLVGVGNCILGYAAGDIPAPKPRKADFVRFVD